MKQVAGVCHGRNLLKRRTYRSDPAHCGRWIAKPEKSGQVTSSLSAPTPAPGRPTCQVYRRRWCGCSRAPCTLLERQPGNAGRMRRTASRLSSIIARQKHLTGTRSALTSAWFSATVGLKHVSSTSSSPCRRGLRVSSDDRPQIRRRDVLWIGGELRLVGKEREIVLHIPMCALRIAGSFTTTQRLAICVSQSM